MIRRILAIAAAGFMVASEAGAQAPTPVLLVHGFNSDSDTWDATRASLNATQNYQASAIHLIWQQHLANQAAVVANRLQTSGVGAATIVVGHSQGGLVSRLATRTTPVSGLLTIGSPHAGAPIANSGQQLVIDRDEADVDEALIQLDMPEFCDNHPDDIDCQHQQVVEDAIGAGQAFQIALNIWAAYTLDNDDLVDIRPGSAVVTDLQTQPGLEQAVHRVSIQVDDDLEWTGPFRVKFGPTAAEAAANTMISLGLIVELDGYHIEDAIDPGNDNVFDETEMALGMQDLGALINNFCPIDWNYNIVGSGSNDGLVPWESQVMPNSQTDFLEDVAHTEETSQAAKILTQLNAMTGR